MDALRCAKSQTKPTVNDVLREVLELAHDIAPGWLMPSAVTTRLEEAGFVIVSIDDYENDKALAYQAGFERGAE